MWPAEKRQPENSANNMNKNKIHSLWPIFVGEFHNPNHQEVKKDLIEFFKEYEANNENSREGSR